MNKDHEFNKTVCLCMILSCFIIRRKLVLCLVGLQIVLKKESYVNIVPPHHYKLRSIHATGWMTTAKSSKKNHIPQVFNNNMIFIAM